MDDSLTEKIRAVLSDPESAAKIAQIASSLSGGGSAPADEPHADAGAKPDAETAESQTVGAFSSSPSLSPSFRGKACDPRVDLLRALRPFVDGEKQRRLDDLLQIASIVSLLGTMKRH